MKRLFFLLILTAVASFAQAAHTATLTWTDTANPSGTTYNVYRATGLCSGSPTFSKIAAGITLKTFPDQTIQVGNSCYVVSATVASVESGPSNTSAAAVTPFAPTLGPVQVAMVDVFIPECQEKEPDTVSGA